MPCDRRSFSVFLTGSALSTRSWAQGKGEAPMRIVCPYAVGGGTDLLTRLVAVKLGERLGRTVIVENRPGASGALGHKHVAMAEPDGSVLLLGAIGPLSIAPHFGKLPYDPQRDLAPITMGAVFPNVLVVGPTLGVKNLAQFVALARREPGKITYASTGAGSAAHLAGEFFNARAGINTVHVPYKGGGPALQDLLGGHVAAYYAAPSSAIPYIESGKVVALATTGPARAENLPTVPTIAESGYAGFSALNWYCFMAPGKTPPAVLDKLNREMVAVLRAPDVQAELVRHGLTPRPSTRDELARMIADESSTWGRLIRERKITGE